MKILTPDKKAIRELAVQLRHALDTIDACGSINMEKARAVLAKHAPDLALPDDNAPDVVIIGD